MAPHNKSVEDLEGDAALVSMYAAANEVWMPDEDEQRFVAEVNPAMVDSPRQQQQQLVSIWGQHEIAEEENEDKDDGASTISNSNETDDSSLRFMIRPCRAFDEDDNSSMDAEDEEEGVCVILDEGPFDLHKLIQIVVDPHATSYEDLQQLVARGYSLSDLLKVVMDNKSSRLFCVAMRLLNDYAQHSVDRFTSRVLALLEQILSFHQSLDPLQQECATLVVRSLTAHEEMDSLLVSLEGQLLSALASVARGGHRVFCEPSQIVLNPAVTETARVHAATALMNLSCGPANKAIMANTVVLLQALQTMMLGSRNEDLRFKATVILKNLSTLDTNDVILIRSPGLVHALVQVVWETTTMYSIGATWSTTNACIALMNLSISAYCKIQVYHTPGVMKALMKVLANTAHSSSSSSCAMDARISACSVLSNLAIGYENKSSMFHYRGLLDTVCTMVLAEPEQVRSKACSVLWSLAAEKDNQVPFVQDRSDVLATLIRVTADKKPSEARQKCVAALALLAESPSNALGLLQAGALQNVLAILEQTGTDPTQWPDQTASWCVTCILNLAQVDVAVPILRESGVIQLLSPLVASDHEYQSLKAAMAVTLCSRSCHANHAIDDDPRHYSLLRRIETAIPKLSSLLHNTLEGRGGEGYKYGVFTLKSSLACVATLAAGPDFIQESICTRPVLLSLVRVLWEFGVSGGACDRIVGGGPDDIVSAAWATKALSSVIIFLLSNSSECDGGGIDLVLSFSNPLVRVLQSAERRFALQDDNYSKLHAANARQLVESVTSLVQQPNGNECEIPNPAQGANNKQRASNLRSDTSSSQGNVSTGGDSGNGKMFPIEDNTKSPTSTKARSHPPVVRTFVLMNERNGLMYIVPASGDTHFLDTSMQWCFRRGRYCGPGERPDPTFEWTAELQHDYDRALLRKCPCSSGTNNDYQELVHEKS